MYVCVNNFTVLYTSIAARANVVLLMRERREDRLGLVEAASKEPDSCEIWPDVCVLIICHMEVRLAAHGEVGGWGTLRASIIKP